MVGVQELSPGHSNMSNMSNWSLRVEVVHVTFSKEQSFNAGLFETFLRDLSFNKICFQTVSLGPIKDLRLKSLE